MKEKERMKKIFVLAALALTLAACNKQDIQPVGQNDGMITLTATLAPKGAATKAISEDGNTLKADWAVNEELAILYMVGGTKKYTSATVTEVDASGAATIAFAVESGTEDNTACTVVYPASLVGGDPDFDVTSNAALIGNQPGTLDGRLDVRVTTGEISPVNPAAGLVLDTPLAPKYAIVKFTLRDLGNAPLSAQSLAVTIGNDAFVATPGSAASEFYLALPAVSGGTLIFSVPGNEGTSSYRSFKGSLTIEAGKYYRSTVQMVKQSDNATYVPMGNGKKWALKNVGASSPADYGDYFAWGCAEPYYTDGHSQDSPMAAAGWKVGKSGYNWANYAFTADGGSTFTKYCPTYKTDYWGASGSPDNKLVLESADDAATKKLGTTWRMPTIEEWEALLETSDFTWAWVEDFNGSGKNGHLVISRISGVEGNCIFLPAAGYRDDASLDYTGSLGAYWSSSLDTGDPNCAYLLYFYPDYPGWDYEFRSYGLSVRPVTE